MMNRGCGTVIHSVEKNRVKHAILWFMHAALIDK
jgi:hypothetical protein